MAQPSSRDEPLPGVPVAELAGDWGQFPRLPRCAVGSGRSLVPLGDSRIDMNLVVSRVAYCFSAIVIPGVAWGFTFKFMGRFQLPEASGTSLLWKVQCVAALLTVAICVGLRGRSSLVIALSFVHLGLSLLLIAGALLLQLWMLQPMDR